MMACNNKKSDLPFQFHSFSVIAQEYGQQIIIELLEHLC